MDRIARAARFAAVVIAVAGCVRRSDFVVPPPSPVDAMAPAPGVAPPSGPLTADEAVRVALERNPDLRAAAARIAAARAVAAAANAAYLPRLSTEVAYLRGDQPSAYLFKQIDARRLPPNTDFNHPGEIESLEGSVALRWNLWNGGRDQLAAWAAATSTAAAEADRDAARNALVAAVVGAWLDARAAAAGRVADEATLRALDEQVRTTRELVDGGAVLRTDLLSIEVRQSEAQLERLRTDVAERLALAALRELLALPPDAALAVAEHGPVVTAVPASATDALARAYARRPEAAAARHAVERARIELAAARRAWLPRLDVETRVGATDVDGRFSPVDPNWTMGVALSADLFDGGLKRANVARALAALDLVGESDRRTLVTIAREVETAYLRLAEARARLDVMRRAHATAAEALALVTTQYRGGAATVTRYLETEGALARARAAEVAGGLDVARAEVEVARAIGDLAAEPPPGGAT